MKLFIAFLLITMLRSSLADIKVEVFAKKTDGDVGSDNTVELNTTMSTCGKVTGVQSVTESEDVLKNTYFDDFGLPIASTTFTGNPAVICIRVIEIDGSSTTDDGVCNIRIANIWSAVPTTISSAREGDNGLALKYVINARITAI